MPLEIDSPLTELRGIGPVRAREVGDGRLCDLYEIFSTICRSATKTAAN